ncbi:6832_t:CDS:1 [Paraglomus brasilianum]|uniref:6832_t:CDS:1 n=1 Tax=Paraglomus brasilianum TaxID=144538 RepID=A0A9N9CTD9_9GLOM|nr:6832_t:CDS:1 [Paraglomus brasilianum]
MRTSFFNLLVLLNKIPPVSQEATLRRVQPSVTVLVDGLTSQIALFRNTLQHYYACPFQIIFNPSNSIRQNKFVWIVSPIITITIASLLIAIILAIRLLRLQSQLKDDEQFEYWKYSGSNAISTFSDATESVGNEIAKENEKGVHKFEEDVWVHEEDGNCLRSVISDGYANNVTGLFDDAVRVSDNISLDCIKVELHDEMDPVANAYGDLCKNVVVPIVKVRKTKSFSQEKVYVWHQGM